MRIFQVGLARVIGLNHTELGYRFTVDISGQITEARGIADLSYRPLFPTLCKRIDREWQQRTGPTLYSF